MAALAGLVGGTGLAGLFAARGAVTDLTSQRVPAVVHLLNVQREIAEANYAGITAIFDPNTRRTAKVDLPRTLSMSAAATARLLAQWRAVWRW